MIDDLTVCYGITPDNLFRKMAACSAFTVARRNPGTRIRIVEGDPLIEKNGWSVKPIALPDDPPGHVLFLDADTLCARPVEELDEDTDFAARKGRWALTGRRKNEERYKHMFDYFGVPEIDYFNSGAFLCRQHMVAELKKSWSEYMQALWDSRGKLSDPFKKRWRMLDQYALALAVSHSGCSVGEWSRRQHSYKGWGERAGVINHIGYVRWTDPFPVEGLRGKEKRSGGTVPIDGDSEKPPKEES